MGTLNYSSPEQVLSAKTATPRSDIFSLGVILYELATGVLPFDAPTDYELMDQIVKGRYLPPDERNARIDPVLAAVIKRALDSDPEKRFGSCAEMADAIRRTAAPRPLPRAEVPPEPRASDSAFGPRTTLDADSHGQRDGLRIAAAVVVVVAILGLGIYLYSRKEDPSPAVANAPRLAGTSDTRLRPKRGTVSSTMRPGGGYSFEPTNLIDGNLTTSWQPSKRELDNGAMWLQLDFDNDVDVASIRVANGFQVTDKNGDEFALNSRIASARVRFSDGSLLPLSFSGTERGFVQFDVVPRKKTASVRIVVDRIHRGASRPRGAQFTDDLAVSEIEVVGSPSD